MKYFGQKLMKTINFLKTSAHRYMNVLDKIFTNQKIIPYRGYFIRNMKVDMNFLKKI